ncbi:hypothetical protein D3C87_301050 [compost metagenome]
MKSFVILMSFVLSLASFKAQAISAEEAFANTVDKIIDDKNGKFYQEQDVPLDKIDPLRFKKLVSLAESQTDTWWDTILEGDYLLSQEPLRLQELLAIRDLKGKLVAFKMDYSVKAWDIANCDVDLEALDKAEVSEYDQMLSECRVGNIMGSSFVSPNLQLVMRNYDETEDFSD